MSLVLGLVHSFLGIAAGLERHLRRTQHLLDASLYGRRVVAQYMQAGPERNHLDFRFLAEPLIVLRNVRCVVKREVHRSGIVCVHLQDQTMRRGIGCRRDQGNRSGVLPHRGSELTRNIRLERGGTRQLRTRCRPPSSAAANDAANKTVTALPWLPSQCVVKFSSDSPAHGSSDTKASRSSFTKAGIPLRVQAG
jgi:hypothetical protein